MDKDTINNSKADGKKTINKTKAEGGSNKKTTINKKLSLRDYIGLAYYFETGKRVNSFRRCKKPEAKKTQAKRRRPIRAKATAGADSKDVIRLKRSHSRRYTPPHHSKPAIIGTLTR